MKSQQEFELYKEQGGTVMQLPKEVEKIINDPKTIKALTTVDKDGNPHTVPLGSMRVIDGNIAFLELLDTCKTQKNMLNCYWFKKDVSILVVDDWQKGNVYQIKGSPYKLLRQGPIWDNYLEEIWKIIPDADPTGVWLITPKEVVNQNYFLRRKAEEERRANFTRWQTFKGARK
jgi:hypothetical protein